VQKHINIRPRTYWIEYPFYTVINGAKQKLNFGHRPSDLSHIDTIEQKAWKKHQTYLNRLEQFPLDKAEYYLRIKEAYGINSIRGLAKMIGEDWSHISRILKTLDLPKPIREYFKSNRSNPDFVKFFNLRRILDVVRQDEERLQLACFHELKDVFKNLE